MLKRCAITGRVGDTSFVATHLREDPMKEQDIRDISGYKYRQ